MRVSCKGFEVWLVPDAVESSVTEFHISGEKFRQSFFLTLEEMDALAEALSKRAGMVRQMEGLRRQEVTR